MVGSVALNMPPSAASIFNGAPLNRYETVGTNVPSWYSSRVFASLLE